MENKKNLGQAKSTKNSENDLLAEKDRDSRNWPPVEGRYKVGNRDSPVAVCTNASIDEIKINPQKVAIWGKCVTENIGIEKIIQNIVSNPNIRYLVLCGRESKGHFVAQAIEALKKMGLMIIKG